MERITDLLDLHHDFAEVLTEIRTAVMDADLPAAAVRMAWLTRALSEHAKTEESLLFPLYEGADYPANGSPEVLRRDHALLLRHLTVNLYDTDDVALANQLALFAGALEHHDLRESRYFKPLVDARITDDNRRHILSVFAAQMDALPPRPTQDIVRSRGVFQPSGHALTDAQTALAQGDEDPRWLLAIRCDHPKAQRLQRRACQALAAGDRVGAYDTLRLLALFPRIAE